MAGALHRLPGRLKLAAARLICWWFGCLPAWDEGLLYDWHLVPCERCGAPDTSYADRCGDTRHQRLMERLRHLRYRLLESWRRKPCPACGRRGGCTADCDGIPF